MWNGIINENSNVYNNATIAILRYNVQMHSGYRHTDSAWHVNYFGVAQARPNENIITNARITLRA